MVHYTTVDVHPGFVRAFENDARAMRWIVFKSVETDISDVAIWTYDMPEDAIREAMRGFQRELDAREEQRVMSAALAAKEAACPTTTQSGA